MTKLKKILQVEDIKKSYTLYDRKVDILIDTFNPFNKLGHKINVLKGISFTLLRGDVLGIIGPNGAGKSTLLKIISDVSQPDNGKVSLYGTIESILELGSTFNHELTGIENIRFYLRVKGVKGSRYKELEKKIIEYSSLGEFIDQPVKTYSSGMFARLAFSVAISMDFDILIVDEALSVGDERFKTKCIKTMQGFADEGKSIIFVSHDLHAIKYFCNKVMRIQKGQVIEFGDDVINITERYEKNINPDFETSVSKNNTKYVTINSIKFIDINEKEKSVFKVGEPFKIKIEYELNEYLKNMFFGVGFRNSKGEYINGSNTKIDKFNIDPKEGKKTIVLEYEDLNLYKDSYSLWAVFYDSSGNIVLADLFIKNAFQVESQKQLCEGIININHNWSYEA